LGVGAQSAQELRETMERFEKIIASCDDRMAKLRYERDSALEKLTAVTKQWQIWMLVHRVHKNFSAQ